MCPLVVVFDDFMYLKVQSEVKYDSCSSVCGLRDVVYRYLKSQDWTLKL